MISVFLWVSCAKPNTKIMMHRIHDYITSSQQLVGLAMLGLILLLPAVARFAGNQDGRLSN